MLEALATGLQASALSQALRGSVWLYPLVNTGHVLGIALLFGAIVYPGGQVTEVAGVDAGDCHMRVVSFTTADSFSRVLEYYRSHAARAGFSAEQQRRGDAHVLGGVRGDAAYYLIVTPAERGSSVALIVNRGA